MLSRAGQSKNSPSGVAVKLLVEKSRENGGRGGAGGGGRARGAGGRRTLREQGRETEGPHPPDLCVSTAWGVRGSVSEKVLIEVSIRAATRRIQAAKARGAAVVKAVVSNDKRAESEIRTCLEVYDGAVADLQSSLGVLRRGSMTDVEVLLSSAMTDVDTCDEGYDEAGEKSPLASPDREINELVGNAMALAQASTKGRH